MSCSICHELLLEDARTMDMTCCSTTSHTNCIFQNLTVSSSLTQTFIKFPCCETVWATPFIYVPHIMHDEDQDQDQEPNPEITPVMREEIKKIKKAVAANNKGLLLAKRAIKAAHDTFRAQSAPLIASLKAMKREAMLGAKLTFGFHEGTRSRRALHIIYECFKKQFNIHNMYVPWLPFGRMRRWGWRTPTTLMKRKFRIRI